MKFIEDRGSNKHQKKIALYKCGCGNVVNGGAINNYALHGARISCHKDHRIAMSFAVCALAADGTTILDDETCVNISYPGFFKDLVKIHSITK